MFRARFGEAFPRSLPQFGPQDIERGIVDAIPDDNVEKLLCDQPRKEQNGVESSVTVEDGCFTTWLVLPEHLVGIGRGSKRPN